MAVAAMQSKLTAGLDASSMILLCKAASDRDELWGLLSDLYVLAVPVAVWGEITRFGYDGAAFFAAHADLFAIIDDAEAAGQELPREPSIGIGERSAVGLYLSKRAAFVVVDDRRAAQFCRKLRIPYVNALLLSRLLVLADLLDRPAGELLLERLATIGRYSKEIIRYARQCPDADLLGFLAPGRRGLPD